MLWYMNINNKLLVILGNGPSLKSINFDLLRDYNIDTFGLNMAYRKYKELNFQPTYFGCFDYVVCRHSKAEFSQLVLDWPETKFFFVNVDYANGNKQIFDQDIVDMPNFIKINHIYKHHGKNLHDKIATCFETFIDGGNTGANSTQVGLIYGYNDIVLIGCDANYIEKVDGAEYIKEGARTRLKITKTPDTNANYWFNDYQQVGDVYNIPQCKKWHIDEWDRLGKLYKNFFPEANILNGSSISNISAFPKVNFNKAIISFLRKIKPNLMVNSKYKLGHKVKNITKLELRNLLINKVLRYGDNYKGIPNDKRQYLLKTDDDIVVKDDINNFKEKFITFIMPLKNRSCRAKNSIETIVNDYTARYCDFMVVEDFSKDMLDINYFIYRDYITHYKVNTGVSWTRSGLLNFGIKRATTPLVLFWDADVLYPDNFVNLLKDYCNKIDFTNYIFAINMFETHDVPLKKRVTFLNGQPYSHVWVHNRQMLVDIKGFDENIQGHGYEERDLHIRLKIKDNIRPIYSAYLCRDLFACHYSHGDGLRGSLNTIHNRAKSISNINAGNIIANKDKWGEFNISG